MVLNNLYKPFSSILSICIYLFEYLSVPIYSSFFESINFRTTICTVMFY